MTEPNEVHCRVAIAAPIATITLDRPAARNAYSDEMCAQLCQALDAIERDQNVRVAILTGNGKSFHAGGDIKAMRARSGMFAGDPAELRQRYLDGIQAVPRRIAQFRKPLICAINGAAIGAGLDLACMCDLRIAAQSAKLGSTFVPLLHAAATSAARTTRVSRYIGQSLVSSTSTTPCRSTLNGSLTMRPNRQNQLQCESRIRASRMRLSRDE